MKDYEALGRVLALLGRSNLADDLNTLERDVSNGSVSIDPATALAIKQACIDIHEMRSDLVLALGLKPLRSPP